MAILKDSIKSLLSEKTITPDLLEKMYLIYTKLDEHLKNREHLSFRVSCLTTQCERYNATRKKGIKDVDNEIRNTIEKIGQLQQQIKELDKQGSLEELVKLKKELWNKMRSHV